MSVVVCPRCRSFALSTYYPDGGDKLRMKCESCKFDFEPTEAKAWKVPETIRWR